MTDTIVNQEEGVIEPSAPVEEVTETDPQPGEKTDPALLLKSLQEEREKRREEERKRKEIEAELERISTPQPDYSEEGQALAGQIRSLEEKIALQELREKYPQLKENSAEFDDFRTSPENKGMSLATAAKAFLVEKDLISQPAPRKGLENPSGGGRAPVKTGRTEEEIADLRKNNFRQYMKEVRAGTLKI